ncbi:hypothetical protein ACM66B_005697 [Microbotryomycetes sp. NB124-2]
MSLPPLAPSKTNAGIIRSSDGDRVVAASRRPDGTLRKEIKIRPGYTPEEDVKRFRSQRMAQAEARAAGRPRIPGLPDSAVQAALKGAAAASTSRNATLAKVGPLIDGAERQRRAREPVRESWDDADDTQTSGHTRDKSSVDKGDATSAAAASSKDAADDVSKKVRALKKKLRQAELLQERERSGVYLPPAEKAKAACVPELEAELQKLSLTEDEAPEYK